MRVLAAGAIIAALAGCGGQAKPAAAPPADAHAGCVHTDLRPCMISLGSALWFDMNLVAPEIARRNTLDVNGKTAMRTINISAAVPKHLERIAIALTLASPAPNDLVIKVRAALPRDPFFAHIEEEYDQTFLYDAMSALLGERCPGLEKLALYRYFENTVKPKVIIETKATKRGLSSHTKVTARADKLPYCGVTFSYDRILEFEGSPEAGNPRKIEGAASIELE